MKRLDPIEDAPARQEIGFRDASAVEVREVGGRLRTKMEVQVENLRAPFVCVFAGERREYRGGGNHFEEFTAVHDTSSLARRLEPATSWFVD